MTPYSDHKRTRSKNFAFRLTPEEFRQMNERITISGLSKNNFILQAVLGQPILIRAGKFESDRLSLEIRRLKDALNSVSVPSDAIPLLLECRALLKELIKITNCRGESSLE